MRMDKAKIIVELRENEPSRKAPGIIHLRMHGSMVRGEATVSSGVDMIGDFARPRKLSLIGRVKLENRLTDLGVKADLADGEMLLPEVLEPAQRESILVS
jgi:predicted nucleotidyltransferase